MKELRLSILKLTILVLLTGCAASLQSTGNNIYNVEIAPNQRTRIHSVLLNEENGKFLVSGRIRLRGSALLITPPEHVRIDLINETGEIIQSKKIAYFPRDLSRSSHVYEGEFSATFNDAPPTGTKIKLAKVK